MYAPTWYRTICFWTDLKKYNLFILAVDYLVSFLYTSYNIEVLLVSILKEHEIMRIDRMVSTDIVNIFDPGI